MTDNEIIKALECCIDSSTVLACADCPLLDTKQCLGKPKTYVSNFIVEQALDLINRLKADVNNYRTRVGNQREELARLNEQVNEQKAEIEALEMKCEKTLYNLVERTKSEAIKEFAENLKDYHKNYEGFCVVDDDDIDNLVAEMTEGREDV